MPGDDGRKVLAPHSRGVWALSSDVDLLRRLGRAGFDWLALDAQHGALDRRALLDAGRALVDARLGFAVRVPGVDPVWIGAALDAGAAAVIVPSVTGVADARAAARASRYPPRGERSWGQLAGLWGGDATSPDEANGSVRCVVMVETVGALAEIDRIAAVAGVDVLFVGPFDLALALGTTVAALLADRSPGNPIERVVMAAEGAGIGVAAFAGDPAVAARMRSRGIDTLAVTTDVAVVEAGAATLLAADREPAAE